MRATLIIFLFLSTLTLALKTRKLKTELKETKKELIETKSQLKECRESYKSHMERCAMISIDQIQKESGRFIVLYHPQNTQRLLCLTKK